MCGAAEACDTRLATSSSDQRTAAAGAPSDGGGECGAHQTAPLARTSHTQIIISANSFVCLLGNWPVARWPKLQVALLIATLPSQSSSYSPPPPPPLLTHTHTKASKSRAGQAKHGQLERVDSLACSRALCLLALPANSRHRALGQLLSPGRIINQQL